MAWHEVFSRHSRLVFDDAHDLPFTHYRAPIGLFGIGSMSKLYFILSFIHGIRLWRLVVQMEKEKVSTFEGPPLFFFQLLPKSSSFWFTRIVLEPFFVFIAATILGRLFIFQYGLTHYLQIAALMLAMKQLIEWNRAWEYLRILMDSLNLAPSSPAWWRIGQRRKTSRRPTWPASRATFRLKCGVRRRNTMRGSS
jgi:hypothetical protein